MWISIPISHLIFFSRLPLLLIVLQFLFVLQVDLFRSVQYSLLLLLFSSLSNDLFAKELLITDIPIQEGGRIKPLDTYARNQSLAFYCKRKI